MKQFVKRLFFFLFGLFALSFLACAAGSYYGSWNPYYYGPSYGGWGGYGGYSRAPYYHYRPPYHRPRPVRR